MATNAAATDAEAVNDERCSTSAPVPGQRVEVPAQEMIEIKCSRLVAVLHARALVPQVYWDTPGAWFPGEIRDVSRKLGGPPSRVDILSAPLGGVALPGGEASCTSVLVAYEDGDLQWHRHAARG